MIRSFFCILKTEIFYDYEKTVYYLDHLVKAVIGFIGYYNNKRIKVKLKHTKISSEKISD
ncbi:integrase core domain-containing protein, partial [Streptococcus parasanguinis]|nr:integrase core domain-containing protein [Streptococcus parasanguinis]